MAVKRQVNRNSEQALYLQIAEILTADIKAKRLLPMEKIPSEYELTRLFNVSRVTVRQAIRVLVDTGLAVSKQGKGVFVRGPKVRQELNELRGFYDSLIAQGYDPETTILEFESRADKPVGRKSRALDYGVYRYRRIYKIEGVVVAIADAVLSGFGVEVTRAQVEKLPIYSLISQVIGREVARAATEIRTSWIDGAMAELMGLEGGSPVLQMNRTSFDAEGLILETTCFHIQPDLFAFHLDVAGPLQIASSIRRVGQRDEA